MFSVIVMCRKLHACSKHEESRIVDNLSDWDVFERFVKNKSYHELAFIETISLYKAIQNMHIFMGANCLFHLLLALSLREINELMLDDVHCNVMLSCNISWT